jgi:transcription termination/antitermination protein NusG
MDLTYHHQSWLAVHVSPQRELVVAKILRQKGFEEYCPTATVIKAQRSGKSESRVPLFPGYIFCRYDANVHSTIVLTRGVIRILKAEPRIENRDIETVRLIEQSRIQTTPCEYLSIGTRVRIKSGTLAGVEGILSRHKNKDRLVVSVDLIRNSIAIDIDATDAVAVDLSLKA